MLNFFAPFFRGALLITMGCFIFTFILLLRNCLLPRSPYEVPLSQLGLRGEEVQWMSRDGVTLSGTLLIAGRENPIVILCHGVGANRYDLIDIAQFLYEKGPFNIFLFDFRAHGKSGGWITSFGYHEQEDLLGALDYLDSREELLHRYGLFGISMGGSVGILVAANDPRILALCVDSPFADLEESIGRHIQLLYPLPKFPFLPLAALSYHLLFWTDVKNVSPLKVVQKISPRPLYLINGESDDRMTQEGAKDLYERAFPPKKLWLIPRAGHLEGRAVAGRRYDESVLNFFSSALSNEDTTYGTSALAGDIGRPGK